MDTFILVAAVQTQFCKFGSFKQKIYAQYYLGKNDSQHQYLSNKLKSHCIPVLYIGAQQIYNDFDLRRAKFLFRDSCHNYSSCLKLGTVSSLRF